MPKQNTNYLDALKDLTKALEESPHNFVTAMSYLFQKQDDTSIRLNTDTLKITNDELKELNINLRNLRLPSQVQPKQESFTRQILADTIGTAIGIRLGEKNYRNDNGFSSVSGFSGSGGGGGGALPGPRKRYFTSGSIGGKHENVEMLLPEMTSTVSVGAFGEGGRPIAPTDKGGFTKGKKWQRRRGQFEGSRSLDAPWMEDEPAIRLSTSGGPPPSVSMITPSNTSTSGSQTQFLQLAKNLNKASGSGGGNTIGFTSGSNGGGGSSNISAGATFLAVAKLTALPLSIAEAVKFALKGSALANPQQHEMLGYQFKVAQAGVGQAINPIIVRLTEGLTAWNKLVDNPSLVNPQYSDFASIRDRIQLEALAGAPAAKPEAGGIFRPGAPIAEIIAAQKGVGPFEKVGFAAGEATSPKGGVKVPGNEHKEFDVLEATIDHWTGLPARQLKPFLENHLGGSFQAAAVARDENPNEPLGVFRFMANHLPEWMGGATRGNPDPLK